MMPKLYVCQVHKYSQPIKSDNYLITTYCLPSTVFEVLLSQWFLFGRLHLEAASAYKLPAYGVSWKHCTVYGDKVIKELK